MFQRAANGSCCHRTQQSKIALAACILTAVHSTSSGSCFTVGKPEDGGHDVWCDRSVTRNGFQCSSLLGEEGGGEINQKEGELPGKTVTLSQFFSV